MLNEQIVKSPVVVFTGAGASRVFGKKLMKEFVEYLLMKDLTYSNDWQKEFLKYLAEKTEYDLEEILERLHGIRKLGYLQEERMPSWGNFDKYNIRELRERARLMIASIEKEIIDHYKVRSRDKLSEVLNPLLFTVFSKELHVLPFFTTNYDDAIERYCTRFEGDYKLVDGFRLEEREWVWRPQIYHEARFDENKHYVTLFKLHGSCDWIQEQNTIRRLGVGTYNPLEESFTNAIIYPTKTKIALREPYFTPYTYLQVCLENARLALFIGYSFGDYDSLSKVRASLCSNNNLRVAILDINGGKYKEKLFGEYSDRIDVCEKQFEYTAEWINWLDERLNIAMQNFPVGKHKMTSPQPSLLGEGAMPPPP